jgi:hypothetical protein
MTPERAQRHLEVLDARLKNDDYFGREHAARAMVLQCVRAGIPQPVMQFSFDGRHTFHTRHNRWQPKALQPALTLFLTAHCKGGEVCIAGTSYGAVYNTLDRQIESLYRVDPDLADALAFGHGDCEGLHLRKDARYSRLFWARWQPPRGLKLGSPVITP